MQTFTILATLAALCPTAFGAVEFHPPGGPGKITVQLDGSLSLFGCLDENGKWTAATANCATFGGDGRGGISGPKGPLGLTPSSDVYVGSSIDTAWLGVYIDGNSSAMYLQANVGSTSGPSGGNLWYANDVPRTSSVGSTTVTINGKNSTDPVHVYISWIAQP